MKNKTIDRIDIYTDGSCWNEEGGWSAVFVIPGVIEKFISGYENHTTNNRMELLGVIKSLQKIKNFPFNVNKITFYSDSQYTVNTYSKWLDNWISGNKFHKMKNSDILSQFLVERSEIPDTISINYQWVRGHSGVYYNEIADQLSGATRATKINFNTLSNLDTIKFKIN
jgi:ribonuclease HI